MWRNKGGRVRRRGGFARGQGRQFSRNDQHTSDNRRRDELRDSNWTGFEDNWQDSRDNVRNFRQDSMEYNIDQGRIGRSEEENRVDSYVVDDRGMYPDVHRSGFAILDDTLQYRDQDIDRTNIVEDTREYSGINDRNNDIYWVDRRPQELDSFRNTDQDLRTNDFYRSRESTDFHIDTLNRYDRDLINDQSDVRVTEYHHGRQDNFGDRGIGHHSDITRNQSDHRPKFARGDNEGVGERSGRWVARPNLKDERYNDKKPAIKTNHKQDNRSDTKGQHGSRSLDRSYSGKRQDSANRSNTGNKGNTFSATSKFNVGKNKTNNSGERSGHRSETDSKHEHKKPRQKEDKKSSVSEIKGNKSSSAKNKNNQNTSDSSKNVHSKHDSDRKQKANSSDKNREDGKKKSSSSTRAESGSFKKPGDMQHQPRPRSNSGRKMESDLGHFHDEDILSIMADDDGFESEMKTFTNTGGRNESRNRGSRDQAISSENSRSMDRGSHERKPFSRDRGSGKQQQHSRDRGSGEGQQHSRDRGSGKLQQHTRDKGSGEKQQHSRDKGSGERQQHSRDRGSGERQQHSREKSGERQQRSKDRVSSERQQFNRDRLSGVGQQHSRDRVGGVGQQQSRDRVSGVEQQHNRDRVSGVGQQHSRNRESGEQQQHNRDRDNKCDLNIKPAFDKSIKANTRRFGEAHQNVNKSPQYRSPARIQNNIRNTSGTSAHRFRPDVSQGNRHKNNRQEFSQTGRNNNNTVGGRSRFFVASKIKDSYLKRRKTFHGVGNQKNGNRQSSDPLNVHNMSHSAQQQKHGKNEVGMTGTILKDDRIRENSRLFDIRNRDRGRHDDNDKSFGSFPFRQNDSGNFSGNVLQREGAKFDDNERFPSRPFESRGLASQRVKQKYFRGGFGQNRNNSRGFRGGQKNRGRKKGERNRQWDRRSVVDKNNYSGLREQDDIPKTEQQLHDQSLEPDQQQIIFLPNADMQSGQQHVIDQFGQIILKPEIDAQQGEEQVPIQYLPQQFHPDGVPPGEQVVFIPFVNNQVPPGYSENLPLAYDEPPNLPDEGIFMPGERQGQNTAVSSSKVDARKMKPLSKQARAKLRRSLEIKRKQRMEKEIEKKLLRKLLRNPDVNKAVRESSEVKKKPFIKRISPPGANKHNQSDKKYKLVRRGNNSGELEDVSEDEAKYDNVSDLEDVSEFEDAYEGNDEFESTQGKRPVFRKPGQPRKNKNVSESFRDMNAGDIRRVVDQSSHQQDNRHALKRNEQSAKVNQVDSKQKFKQGEKSRRSVYIENSDDNIENVTGQKRVSDSAMYENKPLIKKRRSISPIEITVSNDRYSKTTSRGSGNENLDEKYDSSKRKDERKLDYRQRYSEEGNSEGRFERTKNERRNEYKKENDDRHKGGKEREKQRYEDKDKRPPQKSDQADREEKQYRKDRNYHSSSDADENYRRKDHSESWEREQSSSGKYSDNKSYRKDEEKDRNRYKKERNYNKNEDVKDKDDERSDKNDENRGHGSGRRGEDPWPNRSDRDERKRDRSRERNRNERRSTSRDRSLPEDRSTVHRRERNRVDNQDQRSNRSMQQGNNFVSSMSQHQFQMNQPLMQQSMQHQPFITAQSHSMPLHGQSVMQFSNSGNTVDHSLPPVQNSPMSMPPFPPPNLGAGPDMSLPPPVMVGTPTSMSTMVIQQQPNSVQFQQQPMQQMSMQQQPMQQQQFQNMQPQFQQQQFQQLQSQPQMIQQQSNSSNFQSHQPAFHTNLQSSQQIPLQQMPSGQFQQTQSGVTMMSVNQNRMQNQQTSTLNQGPPGTNQQSIQTSGNQQFVATTPQQAVRGVIGTLKPTVDGSKTVIRTQPVRIAASMNQVSRSPTVSRRPVNTKQSSFVQGGSIGSHYHDDENEVDDDDFLEMLCSKCDKVFLSHEVMRRHGRWHDMVESNNKNWRCDQCEQGFSSSSGYAEHMSVKHSRDSWNCSLCDMSFSNSSGLNRHVRHTSHKDLKVKFVCSLCPASFMVLMHLVQHKKDNHQSNMGYSGLRKY
ncbi:uncharacterized protein LOC123535575 [Mercenaria mercenaria]|uniref:uncharacterized protein LOC123535575 n=1 Tax=Mercenaria mercenaria TaxID=6596 RepID=UPI00234ED364|nr:uncharacterized protein LOC123535575 [Mercenaria mercenaria]